MYSKANSRQCRIAVLSALLLTSSVVAVAGEGAGNRAAPDFGNVGFEKDPPAALKQKFPMCDAFLKVQWIDRTKQIGYSEFETPLEGKNGESLGRGRVSVVVMMKEYPAPEMRYEVSYYKRQGKLKALFNALRNAEPTGAWGGTGWNISYEGEDFHVNFNVGPDDSSFEQVLTDHHQTVCVVYPDGRRAWISEGRRPGKIYDQGRLDSLFGDLKSGGAGIARGELAESWILDVNGDGKPDYVNFGTRSSFTYSVAKRYYTTSLIEGTGRPRTGPRSKHVPIYSFPPQDRTCAVKPWPTYLTTDGTSYFINNQCNLTDLTTQAGK
jgi:hypothetical protein